MLFSQFVKRHPEVSGRLQVLIDARRKLMKFRDRRQAHLLDNLAKMVNGDIILNLPQYRGKFAINAKSDLFRRAVKEGAYEPEIASLFLKCIDPDRDVIDIGANIGMFSVLAAKTIKFNRRVLAIEPTKAAFLRLMSNLKSNKVEEKVIAFNGVASDRTGEMVINVVDSREEYSSIVKLRHPSVAGIAFKHELVPSTTIDEVVEKYCLSPGLIKIDVEGAEAFVLKGLIQTLRHHRPVVISEISNALLEGNGMSGEDIVFQIEACGYRVTDPLDPRAKPGIKQFGDVLCIPVEKIGFS